MQPDQDSFVGDAVLFRELAGKSRPLSGASQDYDLLIEAAGKARFVLLGEASHGTHEFYRERARITRRLIEEKGFAAVAVEADWPDAERVNVFVRGESPDREAVDALAGFRRFPAWMWRNAEVLDFIGWLRQRNDTIGEESAPGGPGPIRAARGRKAGFYGLDLYGLHASIAAVIEYLDRIDPQAARLARRRYACFQRFEEDPQASGQAAPFGISKSCENAVVRQLIDLRANALEYSARGGRAARDAVFSAEQNAKLIAHAEHYYREMFRGTISSWNLRDAHMADTAEALVNHLEAQGDEPKIVIWAHNSHVGDARATEMGGQGEWNLGELLKERHGDSVFIAGFTTHSGTVTAASEWDGPVERKTVRPSLPGSYEDVFHASGIPRFMLLLGGSLAPDGLARPRLERAIGVIYEPETERPTDYFWARLPRQFDAVLHFDRTRAVEPLETRTPPRTGEVPETYPSAL
jgi:erythromycin esterase-like protein